MELVISQRSKKYLARSVCVNGAFTCAESIGRLQPSRQIPALGLPAIRCEGGGPCHGIPGSPAGYCRERFSSEGADWTQKNAHPPYDRPPCDLSVRWEKRMPLKVRPTVPTAFRVRGGRDLRFAAMKPTLPLGGKGAFPFRPGLGPQKGCGAKHSGLARRPRSDWNGPGGCVAFALAMANGRFFPVGIFREGKRPPWIPKKPPLHAPQGTTTEKGTRGNHADTAGEKAGCQLWRHRRRRISSRAAWQGTKGSIAAVVGQCHYEHPSLLTGLPKAAMRRHWKRTQGSFFKVKGCPNGRNPSGAGPAIVSRSMLIVFPPPPPPSTHALFYIMEVEGISTFPAPTR